MKTCPICEAKAFDDAAVCYGCLHRFDEERGSAEAAPARATAAVGTLPEGDADAVQGGAASPAAAAVPPPIRCAVPVQAAPGPGGWIMRVEFCCGSAPATRVEKEDGGSAEPGRCMPVFAMTEDGLVIHVDGAPGNGDAASAGRAAGRAAARGSRAVRSVLRRRGRQVSGFKAPAVSEGAGGAAWESTR